MLHVRWLISVVQRESCSWPKPFTLLRWKGDWGDGMEGIFELCCVAAFFPFTLYRQKKNSLGNKRLGQEFHSGKKIANSRRVGDDSETLVHMGAHIAYILKLCLKANPQTHFGRSSMTDKQYYKRCQSCWVQGRVVRLGRELGAAGELQYMHVGLNCVDIMRFGLNVYRR